MTLKRRQYRAQSKAMLTLEAVKERQTGHEMDAKGGQQMLLAAWSPCSG